MNHFLVVLGEPDSNKNKNKIEDGKYYPLQDYTYPSYPEKGDMILFYCTNNYIQYAKHSPAFAVVLDLQGSRPQVTVFYQYIPIELLNREYIKKKLSTSEKIQFEHLHLAQNLMFKIAETSFWDILRGSRIR